MGSRVPGGLIPKSRRRLPTPTRSSKSSKTLGSTSVTLAVGSTSPAAAEHLHTPDEHGKRHTSSSEAAYFAAGAIVRGQRLDVGMPLFPVGSCSARRS